ncbi:MAG: MFS transporter [Saprospiraceae bacterium]|nr:MFS transporter [Saprospiraceae bacterium]
MSIQHDPFAALRITEFRYFIIGRLLFITGLRMMSTVVAWWLYETTRDPFAIGLIGLAEVIPAVGLALYAGHVIDNHERTGILKKSVMLYSLVTFLMFLLSTTLIQSHALERTWIAGIYILIFLTGAIRAFSGSAFQALLGQLIPFNILPNAITWSSGTWLISSIIGHAAGGFLIAAIAVKGALLISFLSIAAACIVLWKITPKPIPESKRHATTWSSVKEGLSFVMNTKDLLACMTLDLFAVLFGGAVAMIPAFAKDILNVGPTAFGWLNAATDIGSMITVTALTLSPLRRNQGKILLLAVAGFGVSIIVFALSRSYLISFTALFLSGMLDGISAIVRGTIVQLKTPNEIKGRVMSVNSMFVNSSNEFGQFESGLAAKMFGLVPSVVFGGGMTLLVVLTTWFKAPSLRKLEY